MATDSLNYNIIRSGYMRRLYKNVKAYHTATSIKGTTLSKRKLANNLLSRLFAVYNNTNESSQVKDAFVFKFLNQNVKFCLAEKEISGQIWAEDYLNKFNVFNNCFNKLSSQQSILVAETVNSIFAIPAYINSQTIFLNKWEVEGGKMPLLFDLIHNIYIAGVYYPTDFAKQYDFDILFYQALPLYNEMINKFAIDFELNEKIYVLYNLSFYYKGKAAAINFSNVELVYYSRLQTRLTDLFKL
jgi:hypothetical protein